MPSSAALALVSLTVLAPIILSAWFLAFRFAFHWKPRASLFGGLLCFFPQLVLSHFTYDAFFSIFGYRWMHLVDDSWGLPPVLLGFAEVYIIVAFGRRFLRWWDKAVLKLPPDHP